MMEDPVFIVIGITANQREIHPSNWQISVGKYPLKREGWINKITTNSFSSQFRLSKRIYSELPLTVNLQNSDIKCQSNKYNITKDLIIAGQETQAKKLLIWHLTIIYLRLLSLREIKDNRSHCILNCLTKTAWSNCPFVASINKFKHIFIQD